MGARMTLSESGWFCGVLPRWHASDASRVDRRECPVCGTEQTLASKSCTSAMAKEPAIRIERPHASVPTCASGRAGTWMGDGSRLNRSKGMSEYNLTFDPPRDQGAATFASPTFVKAIAIFDENGTGLALEPLDPGQPFRSGTDSAEDTRLASRL